MEYTEDGKPVKPEDGVGVPYGNPNEQNKRLQELRQTFHPSYIPSLYVAEEKSPLEVTFHLINEDHTICNPLREVLNRHPGVLHVGMLISLTSIYREFLVLKNHTQNC